MQHLSLCATTTKPELKSLGAATAEAQVCPRAHALRQVKPPKREARRLQLEQPTLTATREKPAEQRRPSTAKNKQAEGEKPSAY